MISFEKFFYEKASIKDVSSDNPYISLVQELKESAAERTFFKTFIDGKLPCAREFIFDKKTKKYRGDFAFPDKKIVIEINGPHHYTQEKSQYSTLKKQNIPILDSTKNDDYSVLYGRFKDRHEYIKNLGWRIIEIPSWYVNDKNRMDYFNKLITGIKEIIPNDTFDYDSYVVPMKVSIENNNKNIETLRELLKDGKSLVDIARDIKQHNPNIKISEKTISDLISLYAKDHGLILSKSFLPEELDEINSRIQSIPNNETIGLDSMASKLGNISRETLKIYIGKGIDEWRSEETIKKGEKSKGFLPEELAEINSRIQSIPNNETITLRAMASKLDNITTNTLKRYIGKGIDEWRSEETIKKGENMKGFSPEQLAEINRRIQSIPNKEKETLSPELMASKLDNITTNTLKRYIGKGIDEWRSDKTIKKGENISKGFSPERLAEINRRIQSIPNKEKETLSPELMASKLGDVSFSTLKRYIGKGIDEWRSDETINKYKRPTRSKPVNPHVESFKTFFKLFP